MSVQVTGGQAGTAADLAAMALGGARLLRCGGELTALTAGVAALSADPALLLTGALDPAGTAEAQGRLLPLLAGRGSLTLLSARTNLLGTAVLAAARGYADADRAAAALVQVARDTAVRSAGQTVWRLTWSAPHVALPVLGLAAAAVVVWRGSDVLVAAVADAAGDAADGRFTVDSLDVRVAALSLQLAGRAEDDLDAGLGWLARHPVAAEQAVAATPAFLTGVTGLSLLAGEPRFGGDRAIIEAGPWTFPPEDVQDLAILVAFAGYATGAFGRGDVSVRTARTPPPVPARPPAGVGDLVARTVALAPTGEGAARTEPGRIRLERVTRGGRSGTVVYVPATQTWDAGHGTNPMDGTSNLDALAGIDSAAQSGVVQALRAAGVEHEEPLLLVGYSQGGLTSMALATDPGFRAEFSPVAVLTAGSPVAGFPAPDGVQVLSLEHAEDLVTVADGAPNPDRPGWTTVRRDVLDPVHGDPDVQAALTEDPWAPHGAGPYLRTAGLVDGLDHGSVRAWREAAAPFLDAPGATVSATDWVAERVPPWSP